MNPPNLMVSSTDQGFPGSRAGLARARTKCSLVAQDETADCTS